MVSRSLHFFLGVGRLRFFSALLSSDHALESFHAPPASNVARHPTLASLSSLSIVFAPSRIYFTFILLARVLCLGPSPCHE